MAASVKVKGLKELGEALKSFPVKLQRNVMRSALRAGAKLIQEQVKSAVPIGAPSSEGSRLYGGYAGALRDSVRISTRLQRGVVTAKVTAGGKTKTDADVFYAHFIEFGTAAHQIKSRPGSRLAFGGGYYSVVMHPGIKAQPFMRPVLDAYSQNAVREVGERIRELLFVKHGLNVPAPLEEGDE